MIKILAIGNSFSQDATVYLHQIAASAGVDCEVVNLYIGGCSLYTHWQNVLTGEAAYVYEHNGKWSERMVSTAEVLSEVRWDIVTMQQASHDSGLPETYTPYLGNLSDFVRECCPAARQYLHQTWAYETDSTHGAFERYRCDQSAMYAALSKAYNDAAAAHNLPIIPSGLVIQTLRGTDGFFYQSGGRSLCRDGFHLDIPYGRYAAAAVWFEILLDGDIHSAGYIPDGADDAGLLSTIKNTVSSVCRPFKQG